MSNDAADCGCEGHYENLQDCLYPALKKKYEDLTYRVSLELDSLREEKVSLDDYIEMLHDLIMDVLPRDLVRETKDIEELINAAGAEIVRLREERRGAVELLASWDQQDKIATLQAALQKIAGLTGQASQTVWDTLNPGAAPTCEPEGGYRP